MSKLSTILSAFLGDVEAGTIIVGDALHAAVVTMAQHGTRAPVDEAVKMIDALSLRSVREKALRAGLDAVRGAIKGIKAGKVTADAAQTLGADISASFVLACGEVLTAPKAPPVKAPADIVARAVKALAGVSDAALSKALRDAGAADLLTRLQALDSANKAADAVKVAQRTEASKARGTTADVPGVDAVKVEGVAA